MENRRASPIGGKVEVRSLPLESTRGTNAAQSSTVAGWKSARRRWESQGGRMGDNCRASPIGAQGGSPPAAPRGQRQGWTSRGRTSRQLPRRVRDVKRREEKPRRERRRVGSRSLGGRRGTNANRNNATDGQTPEIKTLPHRQDRPLESGRLAANAATVREKQPFTHHLPGPSHPARAGLVA